VPLYHLSKAASRQLVVVLSGEGADELLGGYPGSEKILRMFERHQSLRAVAPLAKAAATLPWPDSIGRKLENIAGSAADYLARTRMNMTEVFTAEDRRTYISSALRAYDPGGALADFYTERQHWDGMNLYFGALIEWWLPNDLLHKADRMTMAHSLELRCPFLDLEFARHCARLTLNHKLRSLDQEPSCKIVLKKAFERLLPPASPCREKRGLRFRFTPGLSTGTPHLQNGNWIGKRGLPRHCSPVMRAVPCLKLLKPETPRASAACGQSSF
jgi:asparagine synthase (glutamine-hydrolysing)